MMTPITILALLAVALTFINPGFTPAHLVRGSHLIMEGTLRPADPGVWLLAESRSIKGKHDAPLRIGVDAADAGFAESIGEGAKAVFLLGKDESGKNKAFCFAGKSWFDCQVSTDGTWRVIGNNQGMLGTYAGDAAMLARMAEYLVANPHAMVPVNAGVRWHSAVQVGTVGGPRGLLVLRAGAEGRPHILAIGEGGDRILAVSGRRKFNDSTQAFALTSTSRLAAIVDADRDGHDDIASWDGAAIRLHRWNGTVFVADEALFAIADCTGLEPVIVSGQAGLLVNRPGEPLLLRAGSTWTATPLAAGVAPRGVPGSMFIMDVDRDGLPDAIQLGSEGSRLWKGLPDGFAPAVHIAIRGDPDSRVASADFDGDGKLDVLVNGTGQQGLWVTDEAGEFHNVFERAGWLAKKSALAASVVFAADLNHDQWPDLGMLYRKQPSLYHFNRGFRAFAEEGEVRLEQLPAGTSPVAAIVNDFNSDGSSDLAVALEDGRIFVLFNDLYDVPALRVCLAADAPSAPVLVTVQVASGKQAGKRLGIIHAQASGSGAIQTLSGTSDVDLVWNDGRTERRQRIKPDPLSTTTVILGGR
jgi:hypothetical protein